MEAKTVDFIRRLLPGDEVLEAAHAWFGLIWDESARREVRRLLELALTNKHLRIYDVWRVPLTGRPLRVRRARVIRLRDIKETSVRQEHRASVLTVVYASGRYEEWATPTSPAATRFVEMVDDTVDRQALAVDVADQLSKLAVLREKGALNESDWDLAKTMFLGKGTSEKEEAIDILGKLFHLHKSGVLSEGEFNMKKWDILSRR